MCVVPDISELDLKGIDTIAIDLETYDPSLKKKGSGAIRGEGFVCGIAVATSKQQLYFPTYIYGNFHISALGSTPHSFAAATNSVSFFPRPT